MSYIPTNVKLSVAQKSCWLSSLTIVQVSYNCEDLGSRSVSEYYTLSCSIFSRSDDHYFPIILFFTLWYSQYIDLHKIVGYYGLQPLTGKILSKLNLENFIFANEDWNFKLIQISFYSQQFQQLLKAAQNSEFIPNVGNIWS